MKVTTFARRVTRKEKGRRQVNIAQVLEILKVINSLTKGVFYKIVDLM